MRGRDLQQDSVQVIWNHELHFFGLRARESPCGLVMLAIARS